MFKIILAFLFSILLCGIVSATDITIGASSISGFNASIGSDVALSGLSVTNGSASVTCSTCLQPAWVGISGFKVALNGVAYTVASVSSRSAFTLTTTYAGSTATVTGTWYKYVLLRFYASAAFQPSGETYVVQPGGLGSSNWFRMVAASVINDGSSNVLYVPEIILPGTTNATPATARYSAAFYTIGGAFVQRFPSCIDDWRLDATTTPTSYAQICTFNIPPTAPPPDPVTYYSKAEIDSRFPSCASGKSVYYAATGNVQSCLTIGSGLTISGGTLSVSSLGGVYTTIQEEGSDLTQRAKLNFVGSSATAADNGGTLVTDVTFDTDLNALASTATTGVYVRTGSGTSATRTLTAPAAGITVSNGDGVSGNPTLALADDLAAVEGLSTTGLTARTAASTWTTRSLTQPAAGLTISNNDGVSGNPTFALADDLAALEALSSSGIATRTGTSTWAVRTLQQPAAGITITNPAGTAGDPTFVLANDLAAVEAIATTGMVARTASESWTTRTITGTANQITVLNGTGVAGDPTLSTPQDIATTSNVTFNNITADGFLRSEAGVGASSYKKAVGSYFVDVTQRNNTGTTETVLSTKTLEANVLSTDGDVLIVEYDAAIQAASSGSNFFRVRFGGTQIFESTVTNTGLHFRAVIWRLTSATVQWSWDAIYDTSVTHNRGTIGSLNFAGTLTVESRGISTVDGSNEVTNNASVIYKLDNP